MLKPLLIALGFVVSFILGHSLEVGFLQRGGFSKPNGPPAYLIAGWHFTQPDQLGPFNQAVIPLAERAGFEMLAIQPPALLEGDWPYEGVVILQRYRSMSELEAFWHSEEHRQLIKLREDFVDSYFVLGVEGVEAFGVEDGGD